jgi:UDP-N-acetylglucosamine 2-epimerase (non-hydrolysing)
VGPVLAVMGTRPEVIKLAPVVRALRGARVDVVVCGTGQHRQLLNQALQEVGLRAGHDLRVMRRGQTLAGLTARLVERLADVIGRVGPRLVVVQGDTTSTFVGALAAFYAQVPVAHVEAGLRTGRLDDPFPEEMNRRVVARLASLNFAPTPGARRHLLAEGVPPSSVHVTGNTGIDSLHWAMAQPRPHLRELDDERKLVVLTVHRRESFGPRLVRILRAAADLAQRPDTCVVYPVHPNPAVQDAVERAGLRRSKVRLLAPQPYVAFVHLLHRAHLIVTDSGGIQEEAPALGVPVLVVREATERGEGVARGHARLVGTGRAAIVEAARAVLDAPRARRRTRVYGDGRAGERIAALAVEFLRRHRRA